MIIAFDLSRIVLPIELISFEAQMVDETVHLIWKTAHEVDNAGFDIEMNAGQGWTTIGFVVSKQDGAQVSTYEWKVQSPLVTNTSFRLKQIDVDGNYAYSPIETIHFMDKDIFEVFPNPILDKMDIRLRFSQTFDVSISLFNILGNRMFHQDGATIPQGQERTLSLDLTDLAAGQYFLKVHSDRRTLVKRVIIE